MRVSSFLVLMSIAAGAGVVFGGCASAPLYTSAAPRQPPVREEVQPRSESPPERKQPVAASVIPLPRTAEDSGERRRVVSTFSGEASYYAHDFHGKKTANGERFNMHAMTAAHRTLPFGTFVRVNNTDNGQAAVVRVNDRGPFKRGRVIDVSLEAAKRLGMIGPGTARVKCEVLE